MKAVREKPRTLKRIRADACPLDRNCEALRITPIPYSPPVRLNAALTCKPRTLDQLRAFCEPYGDAAVIEACWNAVTTWMMKGPAPGALTHPPEVASTAVFLCADERGDRGYPDATGKRAPAILPLLSAEVQDEARTVAAQTIVDWRDAESPHLTQAIRQTRRYIAAYIRAFPHDRTEVSLN